jgi:hypothetical protein
VCCQKDKARSYQLETYVDVLTLRGTCTNHILIGKPDLEVRTSVVELEHDTIGPV